MERYPNINHSKHEQQLTGFIKHLQQEMKIPLAEIQIPNAAVQTYWEEVWATTDIVFSEVELQTCLSYLSLSYDVGTNQWQLSLAGLSALVLQTHTDAGSSHQTNFSHQLVTNNTNQLNQYVSQNNEASFLPEHVPTLSPTESPIRKDTPTKIPSILEKLNIPSEMNFSINLQDASLKHTEITILAVGKPSEFSVWQLPTINPYFIPRPQLTQALVEKLPQRKAGETSVQLLLTAATGMGGIGKTELARHFITNPELSSHYQRRFWFTVTTELQLRTQFYQLANYLGLIDSKKYIEDKELITHIHKWLSIHPGWLMVLDNADDYNSIAPWIPKEGGAVLVTTREPTPGVLSSEQIVPISLLTHEEAVMWLSQLSGRNNDHLTKQEKDAVESLVKDLGYLPLAIAQAAAYLREQPNLPIEDYYTRFITLLAEPSLAKQEDLQNDSDAYSRKVVASTWVLSLRAIEAAAKARHLTSLAQPLLTVCAYLAPKNIPVSLLEMFLKKNYQVEPTLVEYVVDDYIGQLVRYSLLERNSIDNAVSMHNLVQEVLINSLPHEEKQTHLAGIILLLQINFPYLEIERTEDLARQQRLLPHLEKIRGQLETWIGDIKKAKVNKDLVELLTFMIEEEWNRHLLEITTQGYIRNDTREQTKLVGRALETKEQFYKKGEVNKELIELLVSIIENKFYVYLLECIAHGYSNLGNARKQKELLEQALLIKEQYYGESHLNVGTTLVNLSTAYKDLGDARKGKELLERTLVISENYYGKDHPIVAVILTDLGATYGTLGDARKQKELLERVLKIDEDYYGKDHPEIIFSLVGLGSAYEDLGDVHKQKALLERALEICENHYEEDHPTRASILNNLSSAYRALGDTGKEKELLEQALVIKEQYYGKDHPVVATTLTSLSHTYGALGNARKEKELLERALVINQNHYGNNHLIVASICEYLAVAYATLDEWIHAKLAQEHAYQIYSTHPNTGIQHPSTQAAKAQLEKINAVVLAKLSAQHVDSMASATEKNSLDLAKALRNAANENNVEKLKELLPQGIDVNARDDGQYGRTALHWAVIKQALPCIKLLLTAGADAMMVDKAGKSSLDYAGENSTPDALFLLLNHHYKLSLDVIDRGKLLRRAAHQNKVNDVKLLLRHIKNVNEKDAGNTQRTALHWTVIQEAMDCIEALIAAGADPMIVDASGKTALDYAKGNKQIMELLQRNASITKMQQK